MKYLLRRDTLFATIAVFISIGLVALLPLNLSILNPFRLALMDFDFNDIAYTDLKKNEHIEADNRIVIINIGYADRLQIAAILNKVNEYQPAAIGLDAMFYNEKDSLTDGILNEQIKNTPNLVIASKLNWDESQPLQQSIFRDSSIQTGFVNFVGTQKGTIRYFSPSEVHDNKNHLSFAAAIARHADQNAFNDLMARENQMELINYSRRTEKYLVIPYEQLLEGAVEDSLLYNKIILLGYISPDQFDIEDRYLTPMNEKFAGKSFPDMNGVVIHANIISMIMENSYVKKVPAWITMSLAVLLTWLHISIFIHYYIDKHIWFHLVAKIAQLISAIFFVYLSLYLFNRYNIKLDMAVTVVAIILAIDVLYFYEAFAIWMHKKFNYQTIFHTKSH